MSSYSSLVFGETVHTTTQRHRMSPERKEELHSFKTPTPTYYYDYYDYDNCYIKHHKLINE